MMDVTHSSDWVISPSQYKIQEQQEWNHNPEKNNILLISNKHMRIYLALQESKHLKLTTSHHPILSRCLRWEHANPMKTSQDRTLFLNFDSIASIRRWICTNDHQHQNNWKLPRKLRHCPLAWKTSLSFSEWLVFSGSFMENTSTPNTSEWVDAAQILKKNQWSMIKDLRWSKKYTAVAYPKTINHPTILIMRLLTWPEKIHQEDRDFRTSLVWVVEVDQTWSGCNTWICLIKMVGKSKTYSPTWSV